MKRTLLLIGSIVLIAILIFAYMINSNLNKLENAFHPEHNLDDSSFILLKEDLSPNEEFKFFEYQFDNGGFGYSRVFWSVIENDPNIRGLENGILPDGYKAIEWTSGNELVVEIWEPYYYKDQEMGLNSGDILNGVKLKLTN